MKKILTGVCFILGISCIAAALYTSKKEDTTVIAKEYARPTLLSQIDVEDYVVLPVLEGVKVTQNQTEQDDYSRLEKKLILEIISSAPELECIEKKGTIIADYTVSNNGKFIKEFKDSILGVGTNQIPEKLEKALMGCKKGISINVEDLSGFYEDKNVDVYMTVKFIHDIEYPIPDSYMASHTEYDSISEMVRATVNKKESEKIEKSRQETLEQLLEIILKKTSFTELPGSLVEEERVALEKEGQENITYQSAEKSLRKLLLIKSLIEKNSIVSVNELETRLQEYEKSGQRELSEYEKEREMLLLAEKDAVNYLYKQVEIVEEKDISVEE